MPIVYMKRNGETHFKSFSVRGCVNMVVLPSEIELSLFWALPASSRVLYRTITQVICGM